MSDNAEDKPGWWRRLGVGLKRTSSSIGDAISDLVVKRRLDQAMLDEIEEALIRADLGIDCAARIAAAVGEGRYDKSITPDEVKEVLAREVEKVLAPVAKPLAIEKAKPFVVLVVGVNGSGKTTTIGKLAAQARAQGHSVLLAAGERAAAGRGAGWLIETQRPDGGWDEDLYTGTGFPGDFYINYEMYRLVFPLSALGRYRHAPADPV